MAGSTPVRSADDLPVLESPITKAMVVSSCPPLIGRSSVPAKRPLITIFHLLESFDSIPVSEYSYQ